MISPAGSQSAPVTWWRGAAEAEDVFASICDISSFPTAGMWNCQSTWRVGGARTAAAPRRGRPSENNSTNRNRGPACALNRQRRVECPQPPTPHPSGERPWPALGAGVFLCGPLCTMASEELAAPLAMRCASALPMRGSRRRRVGGPLPSGRNPARFFDLNCDRNAS